MKKLLALVLAVLMVVPAMASAATPITWLTTGDTAAAPINEGDRIVAAINEKLDIDLNVTYVPEGSTEKVNVQMASGDLPDIVTGSFGSSATQTWIDSGMVIALNDYLDSYPNLKAWMEDYAWTAIDGKFYGIPFITQMHVANSLIMMRGDWLDKLGLAYPTTLDEMTAVLTAFTTQDPDGDGIDNTYGITGQKPTGNFDWVFYAYGRKYSDYALDENDNVIPLFEDGTFVESMKYIKSLYDAGVIDPEFVLNDGGKCEEKLYQGRVGAYPAALYRHIERHTNGMQALTPEAYVAYGLPPVGPDGVSFGLNKQGKSGMITCITSACAEPEKALAFLDLMVSKEGNDLVRLGIEGIHYTMENGQIVYNEEERAKDAFSANGWAHALAWGSLYWALESGYFPSTNPWAEKALETVELASAAQKPALIPQKVSLETEYASDLQDIYDQYFLQMITGDMDIEAGLAQLSAEWRSQGGDELLEQLNEVHHAAK